MPKLKNAYSFGYTKENRFFFGLRSKLPPQKRERRVMTMKRKTAVLVIAAVIIATLLGGNAAYALTTHATIYLTLRVVGSIALNLEDEWLQQNLSEPSAEAFSALKEHDISVEKLQRNDSMVWRFTKTE